MPNGPLYRMRVYEFDDVTVLTPIAGAPHSDSFAVTSGPEHTDTIVFKPYMETVKGRRGKINLFSKTTDTGIGEVRLLDKRTGTGNLARWVTAFLGDDEKKQRLIGKKFLIEESIDGGTTWSDYYTGFFSKLNWGPEKLWLSVGLRDTGHIMKQAVFGQLPHASLTKAYRPSIMPVGIISDVSPAQLFGNVNTTPQITATVEEVGFGYMVLKDMTGIDGVRGTYHDQIADLWGRIGNRRPKFGVADAAWPQVMRCNIRRVSPTAIDDDFTVTALKFKGSQMGSGEWINRVQVTSLINRQDPKAGYVGDFAADQTVTFHIFPDVDVPVSEEFPIFIDDMNHKEVLRDLLDGKYGRLNSDGTVRWTIPYNAADLTNDDTRPEARAVITGEEELADIITNWCQQFNYAYRTDESGEVRLIDTKPPDGTVSPSTITDDDLADGGQPNWEVNDDSVVNEFRTRMYEDVYLDIISLLTVARRDEPFPPGGIVFRPVEFRARGGFSDHKPKPKEIDGFWLHGNLHELMFETQEALFKRAWVEGLGHEMLGPFGRGAHKITLRCRRRTSGGNPEGCVEGDWRIIDVDALPDPGTNQRGGARLVRCVSRYNDGDAIVLTFIDMGEDIQANDPTFTSVAQIAGATTYAQRLALLQNVENDPIRIELSVTTTGVGTRPTTGWHFGGMATADGDFDIAILPAGKRVWWRVRSEVTDGNRLKVPSNWIYPTTPGVGYVDTAALGTPSGLSDSVSGTVATLSWTNPSADLRVQVLVALDTETLEVVATLGPGSTQFTAYELRDHTDFLVSTIYDWGVRVISPNSSPGPTATDTFTTGGTKATAPDMLGPPDVYSLEIPVPA